MRDYYFSVLVSSAMGELVFPGIVRCNGWNVSVAGYIVNIIALGK